MFLRKSFNEQNEIEMLKLLKSDSEVAKSTVNLIRMKLKVLMQNDPIAFHELVKKCKNEQYEMRNDTKEVVAKLALIDSNGLVHPTIKDIVLSAAEGKGLNMSLSSPVAPEPTIRSRM